MIMWRKQERVLHEEQLRIDPPRQILRVGDCSSQSLRISASSPEWNRIKA